MELAPLSPGKAVSVPCSGCPVPFGRLHYSLDETRISRQHVSAACTPGPDSVLLTAHKPTYIQRAGVQQVEKLPAGQSCELHVGDVVYLLKDGSNFTAGFKLQHKASPTHGHGSNSQHGSINQELLSTSNNQQQQQPQLQLQQPSTLEGFDTRPAAKRRKTEAAVAGTTQGQHAMTSAAGGPTGAGSGTTRGSAVAAGIATSAAAGAAGPAPSARIAGRPDGCVEQQPQQSEQFFAGVHLVDWDGHHTHMALKKASEAGADVCPWVDAATTHIIARHGLTADEAKRRLAAQAQNQQRQQRHNLQRRRPKDGHLLHHHQQQQQGSQQQAAVPSLGSQSQALNAKAASLSQQQPGSQLSQEQVVQPGQQLQEPETSLPPNILFVTVAWITHSLKMRQRLLEAEYMVELQQQIEGSMHAHSEPLPPSPAAAAAAAARADSIAAAAAGAGVNVLELAPPDAPSLPDNANKATEERQQQPKAKPAADGQQQQQQRQQQGQFVVPGPDEICAPGAVWGAGDRWIEPWDDDAARQSMERLMAHWHQTAAKTATRSAAAASAAAADGSNSSSSSFGGGPPASDRHHSTATTAPEGGGSISSRDDDGLQMAASSAPCQHVACSRQLFCLVEEMQRLKKNYHGRVDQFRIKAANRAIAQLERLGHPIQGAEDIEALDVGEKSKQKLLEILQTGRLKRNELWEGSELHQTLQLFTSVWGCAESTARKWWSDGCRSLDDVRALQGPRGLTTMQQMGLKYYDDFERRIPREEVAEAVDIIKGVVLQTLQELTGKHQEELAHLLHCRALGSFVRGKPDCADIDMLIAAGPAAQGVALGPLAEGILERLKELGYVPEGMLVDSRHWTADHHSHFSWMGVWKGPTSPCHRRLDIKVYPRPALPFAGNYFSSGQECSRALRYWCNRPVPEVAALAAAFLPGANAFHLSDSGLYAVYNTQAARLSASAQLRDKQQRHPAPVHPAAGAAAARDAGSADVGVNGALVGSSSAAVARAGAREAVTAGIPVMRPDSHSPSGPVGRVPCCCETELFKALGLAYVPPHMRTLQ